MNTNNNRRDFLKRSGALLGLGVCSCVFGSLMTACEKEEGDDSALPSTDISKYPRITVANFSTIIPVGGLDKISFTSNAKSYSVIVYRLSETTFIALDPTCHHRGAPVNLTGGELICVAHQAKFDKNDGATLSNGAAGENVAPLTKIPCKYYADTDILIFALS